MWNKLACRPEIANWWFDNFIPTPMEIVNAELWGGRHYMINRTPLTANVFNFQTNCNHSQISHATHMQEICLLLSVTSSLWSITMLTLLISVHIYPWRSCRLLKGGKGRNWGNKWSLKVDLTTTRNTHQWNSRTFHCAKKPLSTSWRSGDNQSVRSSVPVASMVVMTWK